MNATQTTTTTAAKHIRQSILLMLAKSHRVPPSKIEERMQRPGPRYDALRVAFANLADEAITHFLDAKAVAVAPAHWSAAIGMSPEQRALLSMKDDDAKPAGGRLVSYWFPKAAA